MGTRFAYGHERAYQAFWLERECVEAKKLTLFPHDDVILVGAPRQAYHDYLSEFEILKRP
jgi:hypothetical protein